MHEDTRQLPEVLMDYDSDPDYFIMLIDGEEHLRFSKKVQPYLRTVADAVEAYMVAYTDLKGLPKWRES